MFHIEIPNYTVELNQHSSITSYEVIRFQSIYEVPTIFLFNLHGMFFNLCEVPETRSFCPVFQLLLERIIKNVFESILKINMLWFQKIEAA